MHFLDTYSFLISEMQELWTQSKSFGNEKGLKGYWGFSSSWSKQEGYGRHHLSEKSCPLILRGDAQRLNFQDLIACYTSEGDHCIHMSAFLTVFISSYLATVSHLYYTRYSACQISYEGVQNKSPQGLPCGMGVILSYRQLRLWAEEKLLPAPLTT